MQPDPQAAVLASPLLPKELRVNTPDSQLCVVRFSPCGKFLVAGTHDGKILRWDATGAELKPLGAIEGHHGWVQSLVFAPEGKWLYAADSWGQLACWPYADDKPVAHWSIAEAHDGWIRALSISVDGTRLATAGKDRLVRLWDSADGMRLQAFAGHEHDVFCVAIHPDKSAVASGDLFGIVKHWDAANGQCVRTIDLPTMHLYQRIQDVAGLWILQFNSAGTELLCAGAEPQSAGRAHGIPTIHYVNWQSGKSERTWRYGNGDEGYIHDFVQQADGTLLIVTSGQPGKGRFIIQRPGADKPEFDSAKYLNCHSLALHPEGRRLVLCAINSKNQGNGTVKDMSGNYVANYSPLYEFELSPV